MSGQTDNREELIRELTETRKQISELEEREIELVQLLGEDLSQRSDSRLILEYWGPKGGTWWIPPGSFPAHFNRGTSIVTANGPEGSVPDFSFFRSFVHPEDVPMVEADLKQFCSGLVPAICRRHRLYLMGKMTTWVEFYALAINRDEKGIPTEGVFCYRPIGREAGIGSFINQTENRLTDLVDTVTRGDTPLSSLFKSRCRETKDSSEAFIDICWLAAAIEMAEAWRLMKAWELSFVKDQSMRYVWVSDPFAKALGLPMQELQGRSDSELLDSVDEAEEKRIGEAVIRGITAYVQRTRIIDGIPQTFQDTLWPFSLSNQYQARWIIGVSSPVDTREIGHETWRSPSMVKVQKEILEAARSTSIVLLTGESGSGKDYFARYIHDHSQRASKPYFSINCAAISAGLAESELFGHEAGAFTDAKRTKRGLLELAERGTLLLNEIGELPLFLQAKLLTFLDTKSFTRVGGEKVVSVNTRLIAATNRDLEQEVRQERFRKDLFYRLNVIRIEVPPLRERQEDLPYITKRLLELLRTEMRLEWVPTMDQDDINALKAYSWPGNIRELKTVLERALIPSTSGKLSLRNFLPEKSGADTRLNHGQWKIGVEFPRSDQGLADLLSHAEMQIIEEALRRTGGNRKKAAELLGIDRHTIGRKYPKE